jgi:hypothetical protein
MAHPELAYEEYAPHTPLVGGTYSNVGYSVLGAVLDTEIGNYEQYIWETVGRGTLLSGGSPTLALVHSWRETDIPNLAPSATAPWEGLAVEGWEGPSGGWALTIGDFARVVASIQRREILSSSDWTAVTTDHGDVYGEGHGYGMWVGSITGFPGSRVLKHGGDIGGHHAFWASFEDIGGGDPDLGVALQCNGADSGVLQSAAFDVLDHHIVGGIPLVAPRYYATRIGSSAVRGRTWRIDASQGTAHPFAVPASELTSDLLLSVPLRSTSTGMNVTLSSAVSGAMPTTTWVNGSFSADPVLVSTTTPDVDLPTTGGLLGLDRTTLKVNFGAGGTSIESITLSGTVDTRNLPTVWTQGRDACTEARLAGVPCGACPDGAVRCVPVTISGWTGRL